MDRACYELLLLVPLTVMTVSDYRHREVGLAWLALLAAGCSAAAWLRGGAGYMLHNAAFNLALLLYLFFGVVLYLRLRYRRWCNPFKIHLGWGDIIFFVSVAPFFGLRGFLLLLLASCFAGLVLWLVQRTCASGRHTTVPLVSVGSVVFGTYLIYNNLLS